MMNAIITVTDLKKIRNIVLGILCCSGSLWAGGDTLNKTDNAGLKQGHWIIKNDVKKLSGYTTDAIVEEGKYVDDKKEGVWKKYFPVGALKSEITYRANKPEGPAKIYYENGCLNEKGYWKNNRWVGDYTLYYEKCNMIFYNFQYDSIGKMKSGKYFDETGKLMLEGTGPLSEWGAKVDSIIYKNRKDAGWKEFTDSSGIAKLYNSKGQLVKEGFFQNYRLVTGKEYVYDAEGKLVRIAVYKYGKYAGDEPLEKK